MNPAKLKAELISNKYISALGAGTNSNLVLLRLTETQVFQNLANILGTRTKLHVSPGYLLM